MSIFKDSVLNKKTNLNLSGECESAGALFGAVRQGWRWSRFLARSSEGAEGGTSSRSPHESSFGTCVHSSATKLLTFSEEKPRGR
ncbi:hypothetical protein CEXT_759881, partial [Caerostris extrusa]